MISPEPPPSLETWESEFPGQTQSLLTLKQDLHHADVRRHRARLHLDALESELDALQIPPQYWSLRIHKTVQFLERRFLNANRQFQSALKLLIRLCAQTTPLTTKKSKEPEPEPPPQPEPGFIPLEIEYEDGRPNRVFNRTYTQYAYITVVDGQTITKVRGPAAHWLARADHRDDDCYERTLYFGNGIPPEYAYIHTHLGESIPLSDNVTIYYENAEFRRICQLEIDTNSPHLLDGKRVSFQYSPIKPKEQPKPCQTESESRKNG